MVKLLCMIPEKPINEESVLEEQDVKKFIESRNINSEDLHFLEELSLIPKRLLIMDLHNYFSFNREKSESVLERDIRDLEKRIHELTDLELRGLLEQRMKLYKLMSDFIKKYDWMAAWNLVTVFERRKIKR